MANLVSGSAAIESWILAKIDPLKPAPMIILRDPQRIIQRGAFVVDGWAERNGYSVPFCTGNLGLREMVEPLRDDAEARVLLVDRSRKDAKIPLFYPDLLARAEPSCRLELSLRDFLIETTGDPNWPARLDADRQLSDLVLRYLDGVLDAHAQLRQVASSRFTDSDLYKLVLGAALKINPFRTPSPAQIRRLCVEQHRAIEELGDLLPPEVMDTLHAAIARAPKPFRWLLERDHQSIIRAFTLAAFMRQHGLDHQVLLANLDPDLHQYREIDPQFLDDALAEQLGADPDLVARDVGDVERFLLQEPGRLALLLRDWLHLDEPEQARLALERERLSQLIRGAALVSLLVDLIQSKRPKFHAGVLKLLDDQAGAGAALAVRRPSEGWLALERVYRRAIDVYRLTGRLAGYVKKFTVTGADELSFADFDKLWNEDGLNRLDYYLSDLERTLRVGNILPVPQKSLWPELAKRWSDARLALGELVVEVSQMQNLLNARFQDLYQLHYADWIGDAHAPAVFTHQFLPRMLKAHWDPTSTQKAVIMVFDGLRSDAWDELLRPVLEERFQVIESRPGSALIPTETHLSRKAIAAGCLPADFGTGNELRLLQSWLKTEMGLNPIFDVVKDDDTVASGMTVRYVSDRLEYIVFNFTDENLHHNSQDLAFIYGTTVQEIIRQDVRSVLRELPEDALLFVTSDHGFVAVPGCEVRIPEDAVMSPHDVRYLSARAVQRPDEETRKRLVEFDIRTLGIPTESEGEQGQHARFIYFPRPGYALRRPRGPHTPDRYSHGGLSMAECLVPMVILGRIQREQPWLLLDDVRQAGTVTEDDPMTLEIRVTSNQFTLDDIPFSLSFSPQEIPTRREIWAGDPAIYRVQWQPKVDEIGEADRQAGEVRLPVTVILSYRQGKELMRLSKSVDVRVKLNPTRLRRRTDSKLDLLMGKVPDELKG